MYFWNNESDLIELNRALSLASHKRTLRNTENNGVGEKRFYNRFVPTRSVLVRETNPNACFPNLFRRTLPIDYSRSFEHAYEIRQWWTRYEQSRIFDFTLSPPVLVPKWPCAKSKHYERKLGVWILKQKYIATLKFTASSLRSTHTDPCSVHVLRNMRAFRTVSLMNQWASREGYR